MKKQNIKYLIVPGKIEAEDCDLDGEGKVILLSPEKDIEIGSLVK